MIGRLIYRTLKPRRRYKRHCPNDRWQPGTERGRAAYQALKVGLILAAGLGVSDGGRHLWLLGAIVVATLIACVAILLWPRRPVTTPHEPTYRTPPPDDGPKPQAYWSDRR